jgi:hypothetical protein
MHVKGRAISQVGARAKPPPSTVSGHVTANRRERTLSVSLFGEKVLRVHTKPCLTNETFYVVTAFLDVLRRPEMNV